MVAIAKIIVSEIASVESRELVTERYIATCRLAHPRLRHPEISLTKVRNSAQVNLPGLLASARDAARVSPQHP